MSVARFANGRWDTRTGRIPDRPDVTCDAAGSPFVYPERDVALTPETS